MYNGQLFTATNKLGETYTYRYVGLCDDGCGNTIQLRNLTTETDTFVEPSWFGTRKITEVSNA